MSEDPHAPPDFDEPLANAVAANMLHRLELDAPIQWHSLQLVSVETFHGFERGPANTSLVFRNDPSEVQGVWTALGWDLPPAGRHRTIEDEAAATSIGIETRPDGLTAVTCFVD